ncbi:DegV domain-containing protein [bacterium HR29]|jgi:DegV family protein with EDD domain|nr:DegV domain-containing protein [bacterium HR29]
MNVRIVTDSTCDLPRELVERYGIEVVPLTVFFGDEALLDGVDIDAERFYRRLEASKVLPRTSQPSVEQFATAYRRVLGSGADAILSVHISAKLSGTLNSARLAATEVAAEAGRPIELIDSKNVSLGLGAVVLAAAEQAAAGADLASVVAAANATIGAVHVVCVLDTLEYLQKGGRIGRARSMLGTLLNVKPLVHVEDGEVAPFDRVRTRARALERLAEFVREHRGARRLFVACAGNDAEADAFIERVRPDLPGTEIIRGHIGPIVGVYTGPNTLGVCPVMPT